MTAVFLIRHPRTTWNDEGRYQGWLDAPLSEAGETQLRAVAQLFAGNDIAAVYSSPLSRALILGRALAETTDAPLHTDDRIAEIGLGEWQGLYRNQIVERYPELFALWHSAPDRVHFPGGESLADVRSRASEWLVDVFAAYPGPRNVLAITHTAVTRVLAACALGLDLAYLHNIHIDNCSITTLTGSSVPGALLTVNDTRALFSSPVAAAEGKNFVSLVERRATL